MLAISIVLYFWRVERRADVVTASYREKRSEIRCFTVALIKPMCQCCPRVSLSDGLLAFSRICWETQEALFEETRTKRIKIEVCKHQHNEEFSLKNLAEKSHKVPFSSHPSTNPSHFLLNPENAARNVTCATKKCRGLAWRGTREFELEVRYVQTFSSELSRSLFFSSFNIFDIFSAINWLQSLNFKQKRRNRVAFHKAAKRDS